MPKDLIVHISKLHEIPKGKYDSLILLFDNEVTNASSNDKPNLSQKEIAERLTKNWTLGKNLKSIKIIGEPSTNPKLKIIDDLIIALFRRHHYKLTEIHFHYINFDIETLSYSLFKLKKGKKWYQKQFHYKCYVPKLETLDISFSELTHINQCLDLTIVHKLFLYCDIKRFNMLYCITPAIKFKWFVDDTIINNTKDNWRKRKLNNGVRVVNCYGTNIDQYEKLPSDFQDLIWNQIFIIEHDVNSKNSEFRERSIEEPLIPKGNLVVSLSLGKIYDFSVIEIAGRMVIK
jgi:hypothetical protein